MIESSDASNVDMPVMGKGLFLQNTRLSDVMEPANP